MGMPRTAKKLCPILRRDKMSEYDPDTDRVGMKDHDYAIDILKRKIRKNIRRSLEGLLPTTVKVKRNALLESAIQNMQKPKIDNPSWLKAKEFLDKYYSNAKTECEKLRMVGDFITQIVGDAKGEAE